MTHGSGQQQKMCEGLVRIIHHLKEENVDIAFPGEKGRVLPVGWVGGGGGRGKVCLWGEREA